MVKRICPECGKGYTGTRCRHCGWETFSEQTVSPKPTVAKNRKKRIHPLIGFLLLLALIAAMLPTLRNFGMKLEQIEQKAQNQAVSSHFSDR